MLGIEGRKGLRLLEKMRSLCRGVYLVMNEGEKELKGILVKEVVKLFPKFKEKHVNYFIKKKVISYPIGERDLEVLAAIHKIWGTRELIRFNLSYFSKKRRAELLREALDGCETKFDLWLYTRIKKMKERGERVYVSRLIEEAHQIWKLKKSKKNLEALKRKIKQIKRKLHLKLSHEK
jgi:hypothetical protein